jgi:hypothetical protein
MGKGGLPGLGLFGIRMPGRTSCRAFFLSGDVSNIKNRNAARAKFGDSARTGKQLTFYGM